MVNRNSVEGTVMSKKCKCSGKKLQKRQRTDKNQSNAALVEISKQESDALGELSAEEFNALLDGRSEVAHRI
jgi:hypothetical protein